MTVSSRPAWSTWLVPGQSVSAYIMLLLLWEPQREREVLGREAEFLLQLLSLQHDRSHSNLSVPLRKWRCRTTKETRRVQTRRGSLRWSWRPVTWMWNVQQILSFTLLKSPSYGRIEGREERKSLRDIFILKILKQHKNEWQCVNLDGKKLYKRIWEEICV